tara:strand:- start:1007 stop:1831 length:825 start_codon:yes stop_codon:yes gene_type:complete
MEQKTAPAKRGRKPAPKSPAVNAGTSYTIKKKEEKKERQVYVFLTQKKGGVYLSIPQNNITIYDSEKDMVRQIRYCRNENSIYADEQSSNAIREQIVFREGTLAVKRENPPLIKYLLSHPSNIANGGGLFYLKDESKTAVDVVEAEFAIHEAVGMIRDKAIEELYPVAMFLGINIESETMSIKRELLNHAKSNPTRFINMFDNPTVRTRSAIMQAVDFQILDSGNDGMRWFDTGGLIVSTPIGQDTIDVMTRFCLTEKGSEVFSEITSRLESIA